MATPMFISASQNTTLVKPLWCWHCTSTTVVFRGLPGLLVLLSSPVRSFFLRMFQTVVLATPNVFAISLMGLFCFFSLMMACFTDSDSSLDLILTVDSNRFQMQIAHLKWTLDLLSAHCNWDNEGILSGIHTPGHGTAEKPIVPLLLVP